MPVCMHGTGCRNMATTRHVHLWVLWPLKTCWGWAASCGKWKQSSKILTYSWQLLLLCALPNMKQIYFFKVLTLLTVHFQNLTFRFWMKMQVYLVGNHVIKLCLKEDGTLAAINGLRSQVTFSLSVTFLNLAFCVLQLATFFLMCLKMSTKYTFFVRKGFWISLRVWLFTWV